MKRKKTFFSSFILILFCLLGFRGERGETSIVDFWYFVLKEGIFQKWKFYSLGEGCLWSCNLSMQWWDDKQNTALPTPPHPHPLSASPDHPHGLHSQSEADPASQLHYANLSVNSNSCRGIQHSEQFPDLYCLWPTLHTNRVNGALHPAPTLPSLLPAWDSWQYLWETTVYFLNGSSASWGLCRSEPRPYPVHLSRAHCLS